MKEYLIHEENIPNILSKTPDYKKYIVTELMLIFKIEQIKQTRNKSPKMLTVVVS